MRWKPDAVILVDYPGFNLSIAKFVKKNTNISCLLLYLPKDMGVEGVAYQSYQA